MAIEVLRPKDAKGSSIEEVLEKQLNFSVIEPKYDGVRAIYYHMPRRKFSMHTRNIDKFGKYHRIDTKVLHLQLGDDFPAMILDGELMAPPDKNGETLAPTMSVLGALPPMALHTQKINGFLSYYVFDILYYEGHLEKEPFLIRQAKLDYISNYLPVHFRRVESMDASILSVPDRADIVHQIIQDGFEGFVLKRPSGLYAPKEWVRYKPTMTFDLQVVGWKVGQGKYKNTVGSLELYDGKQIVGYASGMTDAERDMFHKMFTETDRVTDLNLVVEVECQKLTPDGMLWHPRYKRIRKDKGG